MQLDISNPFRKLIKQKTGDYCSPVIGMEFQLTWLKIKNI